MKNNLIWDKIFKYKGWGKYPAEDLVRFIVKNFNKKKKKSKINILEIGCGPGGNLSYFAKEGFNIYGLDFSLVAIQKANKNLDKNYPKWRGKLIRADILSHNFNKNKFDAIIDNEMSCCLSLNQTIDVYKKLSNSLKKKGKIFLRTFSTKSFGYKTGKKIGYNRYLPLVGAKKMGPQRFSTSRDIDQIFKNNYKIISKEIISRTINKQQNMISEWIVEVEKKNV